MVEELDMAIELDYLGFLNIESRYIQVSIIPWLIAQVRMLEIDKRILTCYVEASIHKNAFNCVKNIFDGNNKRKIKIFSHELTKIFKLSKLPENENLFAYFYKCTDSTLYSLHAFYSNKSNLANYLNELHIKALKLHDTLSNDEKVFDFDLVSKLEQLSKFEIDSCMIFENIISKSGISNKDYHQKKKLLLKFKSGRIELEETKQKVIYKEYKQIVYLNTLTSNNNCLCLAFVDESKSCSFTAFILFSKELYLIEAAIKEFTKKISSESPGTTNHVNKFNKHLCDLCPMLQFGKLCEFLTLFDANQQRKYTILMYILENNLQIADQNYFFECLNDSKLNINFLSFDNFYDNEVLKYNTIQLIVSIIHKVCYMKQNQHIILNRKPSFCKNKNDLLKNEFYLMKNIGQTKTHNRNYSKELSLRRHESTGPDYLESRLLPKKSFIDYFEKSNPFHLRNSKSTLNNTQIRPIEITEKKNVLIRSTIYHKIVGIPLNSLNKVKRNHFMESHYASKQKFENSSDIRRLWKKVITEQILLNKMEYENKLHRLRANLDKRNSTYGYLEITPCLKSVSLLWDRWLSFENQATDKEIFEALYKGVPQAKRGEIWLWLVRRSRSKSSTKEHVKSGINSDELSYKEIVKQSTIHQHSILLDLTRTFPTHPNFSKKFGAGQLALFNVLKAYAILDRQVGYCQGLSFIVGILLLHVNNSEEDAFYLLKYLMIDLNLREQYKPDMKGLQKFMYQFSRLLNEECPQLYKHLEDNEITASLYAASWFLTFFSSNFQAGFIARVFDSLFYEGYVVLFNISLSIMVTHMPILLTCTSFENNVDHLKNVIPEMSLIESELIISRALKYCLNDSLTKYQIEFDMIEEEFENYSIQIKTLDCENDMMIINHNDGNIKILEAENKLLKVQLKKEQDLLKEQQVHVRNSEQSILKLYNERENLNAKIKEYEEKIHNLKYKIENEDIFCKSKYCDF